MKVGSVVTHEDGDGTLMVVTQLDEEVVHCKFTRENELHERYHLPEKLLVVVE